MGVSTLEVSVPEAETVTVSGDMLTAELSDGRTISVPLDWYPGRPLTLDALLRHDRNHRTQSQ